MKKQSAEKYLQEAMTLKIDAIQNNLKSDWPSQYKNHFSLFPKKLYKYVPINEYYIDSIKNNYVYLCPAKELDDQFECRVNFPVKNVINKKNIINKHFIDMLANKVSDYPPTFSKDDMKNHIMNCLDVNNNLDLGKVSLEMNKMGIKLTDDEKKDTLKIFGALMSGAWISDSAEKMMKDLIEKADKAQDETGIGSLTENNKSQVMWDMYANHYHGMCIEYDFSDSLDAMVNTLPVVYENKKRTNLLYILVDICIDSMMYNMSGGKFENTGSVRNYIKLFLTKYGEWSFQKEWRIIGSPKMKFPVPKIRTIFIGKNVEREYEAKIINLAKEYGIKLYKQLDNYESLELKYKKMKLK